MQCCGWLGNVEFVVSFQVYEGLVYMDFNKAIIEEKGYGQYGIDDNVEGRGYEG